MYVTTIVKYAGA